MAIISPLPYDIANGDPVDATPVMADLNQIVSNVNAGAAPIAGNASQEFLVASTANPAGAVPLAQAQAGFAAINGSASRDFAAASVTSSGPMTGTTGTFSVVVSANAAAPGSTQVPQIAQTIGAGATAYVNVTASRALDTAYTNNTSRPLVVCVEVNTANTNKTGVAATILVGLSNGSVVSGAYASASVAGNTYPPDGGGYYSYSGSVTFIVPPGGLYMAHVNPVILNNTSTSFYWFEY